MKKEEYVTAISFLTISLQFFSLVQNSLREIISSENEWVVVSDNEISVEEYSEKTAWSDHQVVIPVLFNFYHGLELFLKGLMQFDSSFKLKAKHSIEGLSAEFIKNNPKEDDICNFLKKYTHLGKLPSILTDFLKTNSLTVNKLYEALRYPTDPSFTATRSYLALKYKGEDGIRFFEDLLCDLENVRICAVKYGRSFEPK